MALNHKDSCLNCLSDEQFKLLCEQHQEGDDFILSGCFQCDIYYLGDHRCSCGNRRVTVYYQERTDEPYFYVEAY